jgi:hypothetical protein
MPQYQRDGRGFMPAYTDTHQPAHFATIFNSIIISDCTWGLTAFPLDFFTPRSLQKNEISKTKMMKLLWLI